MSDTQTRTSTPLVPARERDTIAARWVRPLVAGTILVVVGLSFGVEPKPALHGSGLAVSVSLVGLLAAAAALVGSATTTATGRRSLAVVAMIIASAALVWTQNGGPGAAGLFVAVGFAAMHSRDSKAVAALGLAAVTFAASAAHSHRSLGTAAGAELGIVAFFLIAAFAHRLQDARVRTERLLVELEAGQSAQAEAAALRERTRLARDMHDVLAHSLSGLMLQLEGARMLAARPDANGQLPAALDRAHHLARAGLEEARRAIGALRDEDLPGPDLLRQLTAEFERDSSIEASLEITGEVRQLDSESSLTLYRVAQEALTNSRRHARPEHVELRLSYEPDGTRLVVEDRADGRPPNSEEVAGDGDGYGLTGMRERAQLLGGRFDAVPTAHGFRVELWIPA